MKRNSIHGKMMKINFKVIKYGLNENKKPNIKTVNLLSKKKIFHLMLANDHL